MEKNNCLDNDFLAFLNAYEIEVNSGIEDVKLLYLQALYNLINGNNEPMNRFKLLHRDYYDLANKNYHKRKIIRENIYAMKMISKNVVWGSLTFDEDHDKQSEKTKRQQVLRHLNKYLVCYLFVEEYGEENGRYHVHFIGVIKNNVLYLDFINAWHSRCEIEKMYSVKQACNYLTDYVSKQAPRIRRNKELIKVFNHYKKSISWKNYGFKGFAEQEKQDALIDLVFDV